MSSSVTGRLAFLLFAVLALVTASRASALPNIRLAGFEQESAWTDPGPGIKPLYGQQDRVVEVSKRDCLSNGSNYCFGNNVDFCPGCGSCCLGEQQHCCAAGRQCCASGCCDSGQECYEGKCRSAVLEATVTATIVETVTRIGTQRATILVVEIDTSTVLSTVDVTISGAGTQSDVVWVTETVTARPVAARATAPSSSLRWESPPVLDNSSFDLLKRQNRSQNSIPSTTSLIPTVTSTTTLTTTETTEITIIHSVIVTASSTSTTVTTVFQTNTHVLDAHTTLLVTSTYTFTRAAPRVVTLTTTAMNLAPTTTPSDQASSNSTLPDIPTSSNSLSTSAIAGVASGGSILAIIFAALILLSIHRRRRKTRLAAFNSANDGNDTSIRSGSANPNNPNDSNTDLYPAGSVMSDEIYTRKRQPTLPRLPPQQFAPTAHAGHHAAQFHLPFSHAQGGLAKDHYDSQQQQQHHYHSSSFGSTSASGMTTLVGTPTFPRGSGGPYAYGDRYSGMTTMTTTSDGGGGSGGAEGVSPPATPGAGTTFSFPSEVQGSPVGTPGEFHAL